MPKIVLLGSGCLDKAEYLQTLRLPEFYMEDFTILGFTVPSPETAGKLLQQAGYKLTNNSTCGAEIEIQSHLEITAIRDLLQAAGLGVELSDIADTMYQA